MSTFPGIQACIKAKDYVGEEKYEIDLDTHGMKDGPRLGRLRIRNKVSATYQLFVLLAEADI